jgi:hypothetical protein
MQQVAISSCSHVGLRMRGQPFTHEMFPERFTPATSVPSQLIEAYPQDVRVVAYAVLLDDGLRGGARCS